MCGIAGFFPGPKSENLNKNLLNKMCQALIHRGPDDNGLWFSNKFRVGLGHRRLSIIDTSSAGKQPMESSSRRYIITFNGEIYNHIELRKEIETFSKIDWKSTSDTETILEAFEIWGIEISIRKLVGMFAISVWDKKEASLYLIRDRMGEKPLYYGWQKGVFLFGSELKSLYAHPSFENKLSRKSIALFMKFSYVPDPVSIFLNIYKLPPASFIKLSIGSQEHLNMLDPKPVEYWSLKKVFEKGKKNLILNPDEAVDGLKRQLKATTKIQSRSDVPLGAFLSGGVDSSLIVSLLQEQSINPIKTFTIGFENQEFNEAKIASEIAKTLGTEHVEHYVNATDTLEVIPKISSLYDEPFADSSQIPTYIVSKLASKMVNVSLSGDGGDELFAGYNRYYNAPKIYNYIKLIPYFIRLGFGKTLDFFPVHLWQKVGAVLNIDQAPDKLRKVSNIIKSIDLDDVYSKLTTHWINEEVVLGTETEFNNNNDWMRNNKNFLPEENMMYLDIINYLLGDILVKLDRASMGVSLETRVPYLDHRVVEYSCKIPLDIKIRNGLGKWPLRKILSGYLPDELIQKPKRGFGIPINEMLRGPLKDWAEHLLDENRLKEQGLFNVEIVRKKWNDHTKGYGNYQHEIWNLLMFQSWFDAYKNNIRQLI